jgi:hypothetical protein
MTRDKIIEMARQAGFVYAGEPFQDLNKQIEDFAKLVAQHEREACLKAVEQSLTHHFIWYPKGYSINANKISDIYKHQHNRCVDAIQARRKID